MSIILRILLLCCVLIHSNTLDCRDQENNIVDWFLAYKIPVLKHENEFIKDGMAYIYMSSSSESWKFSNISINSSNSIIGNTLANLYREDLNISYIFYNDEPPHGQTTSTKGHNKGVVATDTMGGFWLVHSVPHFPDLTQSYTYPRSGAIYGQSFLCISMDLKNLNKVGLQLQYNQPDIYAQNIVSNMKSSIPELASAAANITVRAAPWYHITTLSSKKEVQFQSFAKSKEFKKELYVDLVAPYLESNLEVETWPNGPGRLVSNCSQKFKVNNIKSIDMPIAGVTFSSTEDHSKWATSSKCYEKFWSCIGDINRAKHQEVRGGGTVCINDEKICAAFHNLINSIEEC